MSQATNVAAIISGCVNPLHPDFYIENGDGLYQLTCGWGVNRPNWKSPFKVYAVWDCPGFPTTLGVHFYDNFADPANTDPVIQIDGFVADCRTTNYGLGAAAWLTMATLHIKFAQNSGITPDWIHLQHYHSNADSVGFWRLGAPLP